MYQQLSDYLDLTWGIGRKNGILMESDLQKHGVWLFATWRMPRCYEFWECIWGINNININTLMKPKSSGDSQGKSPNPKPIQRLNFDACLIVRHVGLFHKTRNSLDIHRFAISIMMWTPVKATGALLKSSLVHGSNSHKLLTQEGNKSGQFSPVNAGEFPNRARHVQTSFIIVLNPNLRVLEDLLGKGLLCLGLVRSRFKRRSSGLVFGKLFPWLHRSSAEKHGLKNNSASAHINSPLFFIDAERLAKRHNKIFKCQLNSMVHYSIIWFSKHSKMTPANIRKTFTGLAWVAYCESPILSPSRKSCGTTFCDVACMISDRHSSWLLHS